MIVGVPGGGCCARPCGRRATDAAPRSSAPRRAAPRLPDRLEDAPGSCIGWFHSPWEAGRRARRRATARWAARSSSATPLDCDHAHVGHRAVGQDREQHGDGLAEVGLDLLRPDRPDLPLDAGQVPVAEGVGPVRARRRPGGPNSSPGVVRRPSRASRRAAVAPARVGPLRRARAAAAAPASAASSSRGFASGSGSPFFGGASAGGFRIFGGGFGLGRGRPASAARAPAPAGAGAGGSGFTGPPPPRGSGTAKPSTRP